MFDEVCPVCQTILEEDELSCSECGKKLVPDIDPSEYESEYDEEFD